MHGCPKVTPGTGTPHVGGKIIGPGCASVLIEGKAAATEGDVCACLGEPDKITGGSSGVFIGGKPAARLGDRCDHGGTVTSGCGSVLIGERGRSKKVKKPGAAIKEKEWVEPSREEKVQAIDKAIKDSIKLLVKKLELLENNDTNTIAKFVKWFGAYNNEVKILIEERIRRALNVSRNLTIENFIDKTTDKAEKNLYAEVYENDDAYRIYVNELFWKSKPNGRNSKAGVVVHELSHFKDVGDTKDYVYKDLCLRFAKLCPRDALYNADNFESFVVT
jgi:uncharacterized Zn-binding protein involved in type VI secretion